MAAPKASGRRTARVGDLAGPVESRCELEWFRSHSNANADPAENRRRYVNNKEVEDPVPSELQSHRSQPAPGNRFIETLHMRPRQTNAPHESPFMDVTVIIRTAGHQKGVPA